jgi:hypothetical protein
MNHKVAFEELKLTPSLVLEEMGYGSTQPDPLIVEILEDIFAVAQTQTDAQFYYSVQPGEIIADQIVINGVELNSGKTINHLLRNSERFALFVATSGYGFERLFQQIKSEGDMLKIYIADVLGSLIAESAGDILERHIEGYLGSDSHTNRFSPGYCGWHLSQQVDLFRLMGGNPCGITLSDVSLMTPVKSISGVIGIGENVSRKLYACHVCELTTCYKRKR